MWFGRKEVGDGNSDNDNEWKQSVVYVCKSSIGGNETTLRWVFTKPF